MEDSNYSRMTNAITMIKKTDGVKYYNMVAYIMLEDDEDDRIPNDHRTIYSYLENGYNGNNPDSVALMARLYHKVAIDAEGERRKTLCKTTQSLNNKARELGSTLVDINRGYFHMEGTCKGQDFIVASIYLKGKVGTRTRVILEDLSLVQKQDKGLAIFIYKCINLNRWREIIDEIKKANIDRLPTGGRILVKKKVNLEIPEGISTRTPIHTIYLAIMAIKERDRCYLNHLAKNINDGLFYDSDTKLAIEILESIDNKDVEDIIHLTRYCNAIGNDNKTRYYTDLIDKEDFAPFLVRFYMEEGALYNPFLSLKIIQDDGEEWDPLFVEEVKDRCEFERDRTVMGNM